MTAKMLATYTASDGGRRAGQEGAHVRMTKSAGCLAPAVSAQLSFQRTPVSLAIRFATALPVISPEGSPPPGAIHWPTM